MSNNITITISEDGDYSEVSRHVGTVDPFGSLVDAFCDAVKAAGYGDDSRFVALGYYWEALDEAEDAAAGELVEPWDGEYRVGDVVKCVSADSINDCVAFKIGTIVENDGSPPEFLIEFVDFSRGHGLNDDRWYLFKDDLKFISRPTA